MSDFEVLFNAHTHHFQEGELGIVQLTRSETNSLPSYFSVGIHPEMASNSLEDELIWVNEMARHPHCLAIGEIGLDTRYSNATAQEKAYILQLELAVKHDKPVILHCVNSWDRCKFLHQLHAPTTPLLFHGFNKPRILQNVLSYPPALISLGFSLQTNTPLREAIKTIPLDRIFLETDNQLDDLVRNYLLLAEIKNVSLPSLKNELLQNAKRIFRYE